MAKGGHKDANAKLKSSAEEILKEEKQQKWTLEQMQVPQQIEEESCGYRMLYNTNKACNCKEVETIEEEEAALEGYIIEIVKMLKVKQQNTNRREGEREGKGARKGNGQEDEIEEEKTEEETKGIETRQELKRNEQRMNEKNIKK